MKVVNNTARYKSIGLTTYILLLLSISVALYPVVISGFYFDDVHNSNLNGHLIVHRQSFIEYLKWYVELWLLDNGRFFPASIVIGNTLWFISESLLISRVVQLTLIVLNFYLFYTLMKVAASSRLLAFTSLLSLPFFISFNPRWDGTTSFLGLNQFVIIFTFSSWVLALKYYPSAKNRILVQTAHMLALMTYEAGIVCTFGLLIIDIFIKKRRCVDLIDTAFVLLFYSIIYLLFRHFAISSYDGVALGSAASVFVTLAYQIGSLIPLSILNNPLSLSPKSSLIPVIIAILFFITWRLIKIKLNSELKLSNWSALILIGLILIFIPAFIVSASTKYQSIITFGDPYIVIYIQYFGAAILTGIVIAKAIINFNLNKIVMPLLVLSSLIQGFVVYTNVLNVQEKNLAFKLPREFVTASIDKKLLEDVEENGTLVVDSPYSWENESGNGDGYSLCSNFFSMQLNKKVICVDKGIFLRDVANGNDKKFSKNIVYFVHKISHGLQVAKAYSHNQYKIAYEESGDLIVKNSDPVQYIIYSLVSEKNSLPLGVEQNETEDFIWSEGSSKLLLYNPYNDIKKLRLSFNLLSPQSQMIYIHGLVEKAIFISAGGTVNFDEEISLTHGPSELVIDASGIPVKIGSDPRLFSYKIINLNVDIL